MSNIHNNPIPRNIVSNQTPREEQKMIQPFTIEPFTIDKKEIDPKYRVYLLLLKYYGDDDYQNFFEFITGRDETYRYLKDNIKDFNANESLVMTETTTFDKALTVIQFIRHLKDTGIIDDDLDLDDYTDEKPADVIEQEIKDVKSRFDVGYDDLLKSIDSLID